MGYRLAIRPGSAGQWLLIGHLFETADEARWHFERNAARFKRIVRVNRRPLNAPAKVHPDLDPNRLAFARYLVRTGRLAA